MRRAMGIVLLATVLAAADDSTGVRQPFGRASHELMASFGIASVGEPGMTVDPQIGLSYSLPLWYDFLHLDISLLYSARHLFSEGYHSVSTVFHPDRDSTYREVFVSSQHGAAFIVDIGPAVYLRHIFLCVQAQLLVSIDRTEGRYAELELGTNDTLQTGELGSGSGVGFTQTSPVLKLGWHHRRLRVALGAGFSAIGLQVDYTFYHAATRRTRRSQVTYR